MMLQCEFEFKEVQLHFF